MEGQAWELLECMLAEEAEYSWTGPWSRAASTCSQQLPKLHFFAVHSL